MSDVFNNAFPSTLGSGSGEVTTVEVPVSRVAHGGNPGFGWETRTGHPIKLRVEFMPREPGGAITRMTVENADERGHDARSISQAGIDIMGDEEVYLLPMHELGQRLLRNGDVLVVEGVRKRVIGQARAKSGVYRTHQALITRRER